MGSGFNNLKPVRPRQSKIQNLKSKIDGLATCLAAIGIYGVISYTVTQRTQEIGIRLALGAQRCDLLKLILGQGMRPVLVGLALGFGGAALLTRLISALLFGISPIDPLTFISVALLLMLVGLAACWIPARRAMKTDAIVALHYE